MATITHQEMIQHAFIDSYCKNVPFFMGPAGIGKTQMINDVADMYLKKLKKDGIEEVLVIQISGANLKEGELGGIPIMTKRDNGNGTYTNISEYTTHVQLQKILDNDLDGHMSILFIDEFNRGYGDVQQELMDLVLAKRINTTVLPANCVIVVAGNPPADATRDYQVNVMNTALEDRFIIYQCGVDTQEWLRWAGAALDPEEEGEKLIDDDILEFIAEMPNMLHDPKAKSERYPTPRGWEMFSRSYRTMKRFMSSDDLEDFSHRTSEAKFGSVVANAFISFIRNKDNPLVKVAEIFESKDEKFAEVLTRIKRDTNTRQFVIIDRAIGYLDVNIKSVEKDKKYTERFIQVCDALPRDSMVGVLRDIGKNHTPLHGILAKSNAYMDLFFETNKRSMESARI